MVDFAPAPPKTDRQKLLEQAADADAARDGLFASVTQGVSETDELSGIIRTGEQTTRFHDDTEPQVMPAELTELTDDERIEQGKRLRLGRIDAKRDEVAAGGAAVFQPDGTPIGRVDTSTGSLVFVSGLVQLAGLAIQAGQPFEKTLNLLDGGTVTMDASTTIAVGVQVGQHVDAAFARARQLKAQVDQAASVDALLATDELLDQGWPA